MSRLSAAAYCTFTLSTDFLKIWPCGKFVQISAPCLLRTNRERVPLRRKIMLATCTSRSIPSTIAGSAVEVNLVQVAKRSSGEHPSQRVPHIVCQLLECLDEHPKKSCTSSSTPKAPYSSNTCQVLCVPCVVSTTHWRSTSYPGRDIETCNMILNTPALGAWSIGTESRSACEPNEMDVGYRHPLNAPRGGPSLGPHVAWPTYS